MLSFTADGEFLKMENLTKSFDNPRHPRLQDFLDKCLMVNSGQKLPELFIFEILKLYPFISHDHFDSSHQIFNSNSLGGLPGSPLGSVTS